MATETEIWRPVVGLEHRAEVSSLGRIRCVKLLKCRRDSYGYLTIEIPNGARHSIKYRRIHVLVAEAFLGPRPSGYQCAHLDGDPQNARLDNLKWTTVKE